MNIQELLSEAALQPAPPTRLTAEVVFDAGRRRFRRTRRNQGLALAGSLALLAGLIAGGAKVLMAGPSLPAVPFDGPSPHPYVSTGPSPDPKTPATPAPSATSRSANAPASKQHAARADCAQIAAAVKASLQRWGFPKAADGRASCDGEHVNVVAAVFEGTVKVDVVVDVRTSGPVRICGNSGCHDYPNNGVVYDRDGQAVLGREDGLVVNVRTVTDTSAVPTPATFSLSQPIPVEQLRRVTADIGSRL